ncbi:hypothetical protein D3C78_1314010 [compost metagenome]
MCAMPLRDVEGTRLLLMVMGIAQITLEKQCLPECRMDFHEQVRILRSLSNTEQAFTQFACSCVFRPQLVVSPQPQQRREKRVVAYLRAQRQCAGVSGRYLGCTIASHGHQGRPQGE